MNREEMSEVQRLARIQYESYVTRTLLQAPGEVGVIFSCELPQF